MHTYTQWAKARHLPFLNFVDVKAVVLYIFVIPNNLAITSFLNFVLIIFH